MQCPKCRAPMEKVTHAEIEVDRCTSCRGIWFDMLEREKLAAITGSDGIDTGDAGQGKQHNEVGRIDCPVCHTMMVRMVDHQQPHIWFEGCSVCGGVYLDAGEFKDFKDYGVLDFFRRLFVRERR